MADWQERISATTPPPIRTEHDVRYRAAAPLVAQAGTWADLGCGNGLAAREALPEQPPETVVLVDLDEAAVEHAKTELGARDATAIAADLSTADGVARIRQALLDGEGPRVVTCFEVVEHLSSFVPLVETLTELAEQGELTAVLSVPNDAFTGVENPHHRTVWSEAAFTELKGLLPDGTVFARQLELRGSALVREGEGVAAALDVVSVPDEGVPTHLIAAFGPLAKELGSPAAVTQADLEAARAWERQRESDVEIVPELLETVRRQTKEFEDWRAYIHDLEGRLGMPPSGTPERAAWDAEQAAAAGSS